MIEYLQNFYSLSINLFYILFFSFMYIPLFDKCNIKKKVKKNGKHKIISQPKSVLALSYLILLYILFKCFTFRMILFIIISLFIVGLLLADRFSPQLNESLNKFNKSNLMILSWKLIHTVFTVIKMMTNPLFSVINYKINNNLNIIKNMITKIANINLSDDFNNSNNTFKNEHLKMTEEQSNISDYICKSNNKNITDHVNSKTEMIKKISEINQVLEETNTDTIEDMTITELNNN